MKRTLIVVIILCINIIAYSQTAPNWLNGDWSGKGFQPLDKQTWEVEFSHNSEKNRLNITYPSLKCSGLWELEFSDEQTAIFKEVITTGKTNCISGSKVIVKRIDESNISVYWDSEIISGPDAYATLTKVTTNWLQGLWTGIGYQNNDNTNWTVELNYDNNKQMAQIFYPSFGCNGIWIIKSIDEKKAILFEKILKGADKCTDGSFITVYKIDNTHINIIWESLLIPGIDASAILTR